MPLDILITVSMIWAVAAVTPGPNFFITVQTAVGESRRLALYVVSGIVAGTLLWAVSGYLGVSIIFKTVPVLYYSLKILGGLYLIYAGLGLLIRREGDQELRQGKRSLTALDCFRLGLFTNLLNPKTAAFMTSLFAAVIPAGTSAQTGAVCIILICFISALWYSFVAAMFSFQWAGRAHRHYRKAVKRAAGVIFIAFGMKLATSK